MMHWVWNVVIGFVSGFFARTNDAHRGIADQRGGFYAQHSGLIKTLGGMALLVAMTQMKDKLANR